MTHCGNLWDQYCHYYHHIKTCKTMVRKLYAGGIFKNQPILFEKLEEIGIFPQNDPFYPYYCCYMFEAYFSQENLPENVPKLTFETRHVPKSVGISANAVDSEEDMHFATNGSEGKLIQKMLDYLEVSDATYQLMGSKFEYVWHWRQVNM